MPRTARLSGAILALVVATTLSGCRTPLAASRLETAPLLAVLSSGRDSTVTIVDLEQGQVLAKHALRSPSFDIAADPRTQTFVTAQAGGVGPDSDRRLGLIRAREGTGPRYVELPWADPEMVAALDGVAYVVHGSVDEAGLRLSAVDLTRGEVRASGTVPDGTTDITAAQGRVFVPHFTLDQAAPGGARHSLAQVHRATLETTQVVDGAPAGGGLVCELPGRTDSVLLAGSYDTGTPLDDVLVRRLAIDEPSLDDGVSVPGLAQGVGALCATSGAIGLLDGDPLGGSATPGSVVLLDPQSLVVERRLPVSKGVVAIEGWRDCILIAESGKGVLRAIDSATGELRWSVPLDGAPVALSLAVIDR